MILYDGLKKKLRETGAVKIREDNIIGQATYYGLLNDRIGISVLTLDKLCKYFNCDITDLIRYVPDDE